MLCPFCNQEMIKGTIQGKAGAYFLPEGAHRPWSYTEKSMEKKGAVLLPPLPCALPACPSCVLRHIAVRRAEKSS